MALPALSVVSDNDTTDQSQDQNTPDIAQHQKLMRYMKATNIAEDLDAELLSQI